MLILSILAPKITRLVPGLLIKSKSINRRVRTPQPPQGGALNYCCLEEFPKWDNISPPLGGQPRSGRGWTAFAFFVVKKDFLNSSEGDQKEALFFLKFSHQFKK